MKRRIYGLFSLFLILGGNFLFGQEQQPSPEPVPTKTYTLEALEAERLRAAADRSQVSTTEDEYMSRVQKISGQIPMSFTPLVLSHIRGYVERRRASTETIIGRSSIYFTTFESALIRHRVPTDLKYLSIVESALNPKAVSPAGARGLWQFMAATAQRYGLRINRHVDERSDAYMSSDAAARFLADLYARYNDWNLAIAAYNCGPGRIDRAIEASGLSSYWEMTDHIPAETANYVPAFIAVAYTMNFYHLHNIYPTYPEYDLQVTDNMRVFRNMTLQEISDVTQTPYETVKFLNPAFLSNFVPASTEGYVITLPLTKIAALQAFDNEARSAAFSYTPTVSYEERVTAAPVVAASKPVNATKSSTVEYVQNEKTYSVKRGDNLINIARAHNCEVSDLKNWNNLKSSSLRVGQRLTIIETKSVKKSIPLVAAEDEAVPPPTPVIAKKPAAEKKSLAPAIKEEQPIAAAAAPNTATATSNATATTEKTVYYKVQRGDSLWKIASKFGDVLPQDIIRWNNLSKNAIFPGMQLLIKTKAE